MSDKIKREGLKFLERILLLVFRRMENPLRLIKNLEKTSENGLSKVYLHNIHLDDENDRIAFNFFVK